MNANPHDSLVRSYLSLRKSIGIIGIALPFVLAIGGWIFEQSTIQSSISQYYHTRMGDIFVGSLCAISVFLWSYCGYGRKDKIATNLAALFGAGVALFPTTPAAGATTSAELIGTFHLIFAASFFITLACISLFLFRLSDKVKPTPRKLARNRVYSLCGYAILACIGLIGVVNLLSDDSAIWVTRPVFWLEAAAIIAFGVSWLTKGEAILQDQGEEVAPARTSPRIPREGATAAGVTA